MSKWSIIKNNMIFLKYLIYLVKIIIKTNKIIKFWILIENIIKNPQFNMMNNLEVQRVALQGLFSNINIVTHILIVIYNYSSI